MTTAYNVVVVVVVVVVVSSWDWRWERSLRIESANGMMKLETVRAAGHVVRVEQKYT
jgi:hypothetical protein